MSRIKVLRLVGVVVTVFLGVRMIATASVFADTETISGGGEGRSKESHDVNQNYVIPEHSCDTCSSRDYTWPDGFSKYCVGSGLQLYCVGISWM